MTGLCVRPHVRPSDCFHSHFNQLVSDLDFCTCTGHDRSSPGTESQGHRSRWEVSAKNVSTMQRTIVAVVVGFH